MSVHVEHFKTNALLRFQYFLTQLGVFWREKNIGGVENKAMQSRLGASTNNVFGRPVPLRLFAPNRHLGVPKDPVEGTDHNLDRILVASPRFGALWRQWEQKGLANYFLNQVDIFTGGMQL